MEQQNNIQKQAGAGIIIPLAIMTFIWSGMFAVIHLVGMFAAGVYTGMLGQALKETNIHVLDSFGNSFLVGLLIGVVFFMFRILSLVGAAKMMKLKRSGFVLYTIPNTLTLLLNIILFGLSAPYLFSLAINIAILWLIYIFFSLLFIIIYASRLRKMR
jgi:hypothetical protein